VFEEPAALLNALRSGPVPRSEVGEGARGELERAGVELLEDGQHLRIAGIPTYGWASIVDALEAPIDIEFHASVDSTNALARHRAEAGDRNLAVVAGRQTAGRGRRDRHWSSPEGGIWCSVVLDPALPADRRPLLTMAAAVAAARVAHEMGVDAGIKWPNDVLVPDGGEERKLAGILTESGSDGTGADWVVLGIGLNADVVAADLPAGATSLREETGTPIDRSAGVTTLLESLWEIRESPTEIRASWQEHALTLGRAVRVETAEGTVEGQAVDVTDTGALVVETATGRVTVAAGDCDHLRAR
jgi:BirA family biotin operon repressor/biotin-[acetyl-CoA-carboxylase] ligase